MKNWRKIDENRKKNRKLSRKIETNQEKLRKIEKIEKNEHSKYTTSSMKFYSVKSDELPLLLHLNYL